MISTRPATAQDIAIVHGDVGCSFRAWAVEDDGKLMGVIGIALVRPYHRLFAWFDEEIRPCLATPRLMRLVAKADRAMSEMRLPIIAARDPHERKSVRILKRLGFVFDRLFEGQAVYVRMPRGGI